MKRVIAYFAAVVLLVACAPTVEQTLGGSEVVTFVGRVDRTVADAPRQWAAGAYFTFAFDGTGCEIDINDQNIYGNGYNYLEVIVDGGAPVRFATQGVRNTIIIGKAQCADGDTAVNVVALHADLPKGYHTVMVVRDTETGMGYTELAAIRTTGISQWTPAATFKMEFIGNSITCGAEAYLYLVPYGEGTWYDRHRAYESYGARTARALGAQWALTSVSGIGLIHSCCDMTVVMPQVYDKVALSTNEVDYDFGYTPDVITICLGQNDGIQDSTAFCTAYVEFVGKLHQYYPEARFVLLSSPMANDELTLFMKRMLPAVAAQANADGDCKISCFFFSRSYNSGGGGHPDMAEHALIADELTEYLKTIL